MSIRFGRSGNGYDSSEVMETEDDDWRQITDLSQRRKIQNRLAQRNYRRKLRQRLEELERQAEQANSGSPSTAIVSTSAKRPKHSARPQSASATPAAPKEPVSGNAGSAAPSLEERLANLEALIASASVASSTPALVSAAPTAATSTTSSTNLAPGDFGPLFATLDYRSGPSTLRPQQPQQPQYSQAQPAASSFYHQQGPYSQPLQGKLSTTLAVPTQTASPPAQHISSHISVPADSLQFPLSFTHTISTAPQSPPQSYQPNMSFPPPDSLFFPALPLSYSPNPTINPNPCHLNPPLPHDEFYLTLNYGRLHNAMMSIARLLQVKEEEMFDEDAISRFNRTNPPLELPESAADLKPTRLQMEVEHHPYIDAIPFPRFRDRLLEYIKRGEETDEERICIAIHEGWGVWGQVPWEARSWEVSEQFSRKWWFLMDDEMWRSTNWWRRQRGLQPLQRGKIIGEVP